MLDRLATIALLAGLCAAPALAAQPQGARERCLSDHAVDFDIRISACNVAIESGDLADDELAVAFANRGSAHLTRQEYVPAIDDYDEALKRRTDDADVLQGSCRARAVLKVDLELALAHCNRALEIAPDSARTLGNRALVYLRLEMEEPAIADYGAALALKPDVAEYLYGRAQAKLRLGDMEGAKADVTAARALDAKIAEHFAQLERDDSAWSWAALLEYWRSVMRAIY